MYNLLIIDDEPLITDAIYDLFVDGRLDDFEIYKGYSGYEALEYAHRTRIDILLVDICMPGMSGFDVQHEINRLWPSCRVIFLTGHDDFEYMRSAIRNQCVDYILKTEDKSLIFDAVIRARNEAEKIHRNRNLIEMAKESMKQAIPLLQSKCLADIIEGMEADAEVISAKFHEFGIPLDHRLPVLLMLGRIDSWPPETDADRRIKIICGIRYSVEETLSALATVTSIIYDRNRIVWFVQCKQPEKGGGSRDMLIMSVHGSMDTIQETCRDMFEAQVSLIAGNKAVEWGKASEKFDSLKNAFDLSAKLSQERLLIDFDEADPDNAAGFYDFGAKAGKGDIPDSRLKNVDLLKVCLDSGDRNEFHAQFDDISEIVYKSEPCTYNLSNEAYLMISAVFLAHINRKKLSERLEPQIDAGRLTVLDWYRSWADASAYFKALADAIFDINDCESFMNTNRLFGFIRNHIDQHIGGDLSLTRLSELLHFHPFYFSRLFKQVVGKSLTEYISQVKLKKARELLKSNMQVNEIAASLGFATASYFIRFFKKNTGQTPRQFRDSFTDKPD